MNLIQRIYSSIYNKSRNIQKSLVKGVISFFLRIHYYLYGIEIGTNCSFWGIPKFIRKGGGEITIGNNCTFRSKPTSNLIGINHKCILSTLKKGSILKIGNNCGFSGTVIGAEKSVILGNNIRCGANTIIIDTDYHSDDPRSGQPRAIVIEDNVWLGVNSIVMKGVTIGENSLIGANSLVTKSIPKNVIAAGNPCKIIRNIN